jgi:hypothetical protein
LFVGQQLGVADDINEQDMRDRQAQFRVLIVSHCS